MKTFRFYSKPDTFDGTRVSVIGHLDDLGNLRIATARCSKKDQFVRRKGRFIAEGRLAKGRLYTMLTKPNCTTEDFIDLATKIAREVWYTKNVVKFQLSPKHLEKVT